MNLDEVVINKKNELEEMQKDIDSLEAQASQLRDTVKKYNSLKRQQSGIKKAKAQKQTEFDTVLNFFNSVDDNYLKEKYPLFEQMINQTGNQTATQSIN